MAEGPGADAPLVTVGVFGYNHARFIAEAIGSVLDSTFTDFEVFVVDDGSSDGTAERDPATPGAKARPRAVVLSDGANQGLAARINELLELARGQWLAILGGDDAYLRIGLETLVDAIESDVDVIWGDLDVMNASGVALGYSRPRDTWQRPAARRYLTAGSPVEDIYRYNNFICGTSPLVRVSAVQAAGGYWVGARNEDLDMWMRLGRRHGFRYVGSSVARYRVVPGSSSRSEEASVRDQAELVGRLRREGGYSERGLARLLAMRWALSAGRTKGRPPVSLEELSRISGLPARALLRELPRAAVDPPAGSLAAGARRLMRRRGARVSRA